MNTDPETADEVRAEWRAYRESKVREQNARDEIARIIAEEFRFLLPGESILLYSKAAAAVLLARFEISAREVGG